MQVIETVVYDFDELSDEAKEHARDWWRSVEPQRDADRLLRRLFPDV